MGIMRIFALRRGSGVWANKLASAPGLHYLCRDNRNKK